jgi:tRNA (guanine37-N1)-methyltransferase
MQFHIITIFPEMIRALMSGGLVSTAIKEKQIELHIKTPREHTEDAHKTVDDRPYGGGDGMIMLGEPLRKAIDEIKAANAGEAHVVYMSAQGKTWTDKMARAWAEKYQTTPVVLVCGRYGGIDQRFINEFVDEEISVGDYILTGGEIPAMLVVDTVSRFIPGVIGNSVSVEVESFSKGQLEGASFTRPQSLFGQEVPSILLSGDHKKITGWREDVSLVVTYLRRQDLLANKYSSEDIKKRAQKIGKVDLATCGVTTDELSTLGL